MYFVSMVWGKLEKALFTGGLTSEGFTSAWGLV